MILGPVSLLDCLVFCLFLAPQLIIQVGLIRTVVTVLRTLPFLRTLLCCTSLSHNDHVSRPD
jgi:hypothetical protein